MASFVVMQAPTGRRGSDGPRIELVRDGFTVFGFLAPILWLGWNRLGVEALAALAATLALGALGQRQGFGWAAPLLTLLVSIYVGLDGTGLRLAAMRRRGFVEHGVVDAEDRDAAEIRYFDAADADPQDAPRSTQDAPPPLPPLMPVRPSGPALGLLQYPGR